MKKKITALLLAVIMGLSFVVSAFAADTLKRVPSTIPGTDRTYNYVENITVKIPGTNVTFDFEKVADFVCVDNGVPYWSGIGEKDGDLNIPCYNFYIFEKGGSVTFNQNGEKVVIADVQHEDGFDAITIPVKKGDIFRAKPLIGNKHNTISMLISCIFNDGRLSTSFYDMDKEEALKLLKEKAVAAIRIIELNSYKQYFDYEHWYAFNEYDKTIDISELDVNNTHDTEYKIVDGANAVVNADTKSLKITADGDFSKFTGVNVDGKTVDGSNYTASKGSTVVEFKSEYLKTLSAGKHTVEICFTDGKATTQFEIKKGGKPTSSDKTDKPAKPDVEIPNTDGSSPVTAVFAVMALSGTAVIAYNKKKRLRK